MDQLSKLWKRKAKEATLPVDAAVGASTSATISAGPSSDAITTKDVLRNTSTFLEALKNVCEASEILGPVMSRTADCALRAADYGLQTAERLCLSSMISI